MKAAKHEGEHEAKAEERDAATQQRSDVAVAVDAQRVLSRTRSLNAKWKGLYVELGGVT